MKQITQTTQQGTHLINKVNGVPIGRRYRQHYKNNIKLPDEIIQLLESFNIKWYSAFINCNGYIYLRLHRKNWFKAHQQIGLAKLLAIINSPYTILEGLKLYALYKYETHHLNGNPLDNRLDNIIGFLTRLKHNQANHKTIQIYGKPNRRQQINLYLFKYGVMESATLE